MYRSFVNFNSNCFSDSGNYMIGFKMLISSFYEFAKRKNDDENLKCLSSFHYYLSCIEIVFFLNHRVRGSRFTWSASIWNPSHIFIHSAS